MVMESPPRKQPRSASVPTAPGPRRIPHRKRVAVQLQSLERPRRAAGRAAPDAPDAVRPVLARPAAPVERVAGLLDGLLLDIIGWPQDEVGTVVALSTGWGSSALAGRDQRADRRAPSSGPA